MKKVELTITRIFIILLTLGVITSIIYSVNNPHIRVMAALFIIVDIMMLCQHREYEMDIQRDMIEDIFCDHPDLDNDLYEHNN